MARDDGHPHPAALPAPKGPHVVGIVHVFDVQAAACGAAGRSWVVLNQTVAPLVAAAFFGLSFARIR